jgi:hypothetical protein
MIMVGNEVTDRSASAERKPIAGHHDVIESRWPDSARHFVGSHESAGPGVAARFARYV